MKTAFILALVTGILTINWSAKADNSDSNTGDGFHEDFEQVIVLSATANAPTNAVGIASLRAESDDCSDAVEVKTSVAGLDAGTYNVSVTDITGTNSYDLGTLDVVSNSFTCQGLEGDDFFGDDNTNSPLISTNIVTFGRGEFDLPSELNPTNAAFLFIFDTNGVVAFTGDFTSLTNISAIYYDETVEVIPGNAAQVQGQGTLSLAFKKGKTTSSFKLHASGLPSKQPLLLKANGKGSAKTSASIKGEVSVKSLPHTNLPELRTVEATDKKGGVVFSLKF